MWWCTGANRVTVTALWNICKDRNTNVAVASAVWPVVRFRLVPVARLRACHSKLSSGTTHSVWSADPSFTCEINTLSFKARSASYTSRSLLIYRNFLKLSLKGSWKKTKRHRSRKRDTGAVRVINSVMPLTDPLKLRAGVCEYLNKACLWWDACLKCDCDDLGCKPRSFLGCVAGIYRYECIVDIIQDCFLSTK